MDCAARFPRPNFQVAGNESVYQERNRTTQCAVRSTDVFLSLPGIRSEKARCRPCKAAKTRTKMLLPRQWRRHFMQIRQLRFWR